MTPVKVLVVDDSVVIRKIVTDCLSGDPQVEVVGTASNGRLALGKITALKPDVVTMDIEMPEMDGISAVKEIRKFNKRLPIIMFSTLTERGASATLEALSSGASDYVTKPANVGSVQASMAQVREELLPKLLALTGRTPSVAGAPGAGGAGGHAGAAAAGAPAPVTPTVVPAPRNGAVRQPAVLVIGSSTGGPEALSAVLPKLPRNLPVPVLLVQHMPPVFTTQFAARLDRLCALDVVEAKDGTPLKPGTIHLAPGDWHLTVSGDKRDRRTVLTQGARENFCRPAVDPLFRSAVDAYDGGVLAVVLTGMGSDGKAGAGRVRAAGGYVIAQDRETSVVWGMPGAVTTAGFADEVVPLGSVADAIIRRLPRQPLPASAGSTAFPTPTSTPGGV
ncbi:two-component system, chemotaxis family, response regulator CheB [Quadrisphaera granulorum]|uniref:Protein-glutamate methylesterase/protein-glutamine glutaminase n=1 Tax=Quadrisphaera granulorum TaxID=317664 RepID=A0A316AD44_9ACTN|nr:chemotaxis response regulator protein-glutamate methylesterase [Quadrisphaera granulorum]PWJ55653.1 two-component system chemotaxis response regulator CheB [Quadrisphaera granulorum]SZE95150.1 two-component system, chemotaxis family, response regulator CheB [Quadrisphaera granulorum]